MMLRRPVAVYRVIDEAELLGDDWSEVPDLAAPPLGEPTLIADGADYIGDGDRWETPVAPPARDRRRAASALLCVGTIVIATAGALTITSGVAPHARPTIPQTSTIASLRPRPRSHATPLRSAAVQLLPARREHIAGRPARRTHHARIAVHRHAAPSLAQRPSRPRVAQVAQVASRSGRPSSALRPSPQQEFGFER